MAALSLTEALELVWAQLHAIRTIALLALFIILFFPLAISLHSYADSVNANGSSTNAWIATGVNVTEDNTWNQTYNLTNGQIAELKARGAQFYPDGTIVTFFETNQSEIPWATTTPGAVSDVKSVTFWQLPLWIQVSVLSGSLVAMAGIFALLPLVVRKIRSPLDNENRKSVFNYILGNPGCTAPEVSRDQGMNMGTVRYHVQRLELESKIILKKIGKFSRIYRNASTYNDREMVIASHLRNETSRKLLQATFETPGMTNQALAERFNIDKSTVYVHMQKLLDDDIIFSETEGKQKRYFVQEAAKPSLDKFLRVN